MPGQIPIHIDVNRIKSIDIVNHNFDPYREAAELIRCHRHRISVGGGIKNL